MVNEKETLVESYEKMDVVRESESNISLSLAEIQEFAIAFGKKRQSLGISQGQLVQELKKFNDPTLFSESTLARFERLDITPRTGSRIKPVLERFINSNELKFGERYFDRKNYLNFK